MKGHNNTSGFTVVEVIIVSAIALILLSALIRFLAVGYPLSRVTLLQANSNETARVQLKRIARELREVRESDIGSYPLVEMLPQRIVFYADADNDNTVERIRYELSGTDLERGVTLPTGDPLEYLNENEEASVVARLIRNDAMAIFTYYSGDYPDDTTPLTPVDVTEVKYIQFYLIIDADPAVDPAAVEVRSQVQLRNVKTNLHEVEEE